MPLSPLRLEVGAVTQSPLPIDLTLIKEHCAVSTTDFDTTITAYLFAAIAWAEGIMKRTIFSRAHIWQLRDFPASGYQEIRLPRGKTQGVTSVKYYAGGVQYTLTGPSSGSPAGTDYLEDLTGDDGGVLMPLQGGSWPGVDLDVPAPIEISFTAGWLAAEVPDQIVTALLFAIADQLENKGGDAAVPLADSTALTLLSQYALDRAY